VCGLVGMVGFLEHKHKQAMKDLLFLNSLRGKDSTGLSVVKRDRTVLTRKMTVPGYEFIEYPIVEKAMGHGDQLWIGHGRFKTYGDVSKANAHPFEVLDDEGNVFLVGAHNGTLDNKFTIEGLLDEKYDTDSEALFNWLADAPDFKEAISKLRGAWALTWWDPTSNSVHFCRNKERPLSFAFTKDRKVLIWASEAWMLVNACRRNGVELDTNERGLSCYATLEDTLYTMEIPQERDKPLPDIKREGGYVGAPAVGFRHGFQGVGNHWWNEDDEKRAKKAAASSKGGKAEGEEKKTVITLGEPPIRGFDGASITKKQMEALKKNGCGWCGDEIDGNLITAFLNEDTLVCVRCMRDTHPKGDCLRRDESDYDADLDDDLPFDLTDKGKELRENSEEYKQLMRTAAVSAVD